MKKIIWGFLITLTLFLVAIQFVPKKTHKPTKKEFYGFSEEYILSSKELNTLEEKCFDCHSPVNQKTFLQKLEPIAYYVSKVRRKAIKKLDFYNWYNYSNKEKKELLKKAIFISKERPNHNKKKFFKPTNNLSILSNQELITGLTKLYESNTNKTDKKKLKLKLYNNFDIVVSEQKSGNSYLIKKLTKSPYTNCGIIILKKDENPYVLESFGTVKYTPISEFIKRSVQFKILRVKPEILKRLTSIKENKERIKRIEKKYLNKTYDFYFSFDNDFYYSSELVYDIFLKEFKLALATPITLKQLGVRELGKTLYYKFTKKNINLNQKIVIPEMFIKSKYLYTYIENNE